MNTLELIITQCRHLLCHSPNAISQREYLNKRLNAKMQEQFGFGYFPNIKDINLLIETIGEEQLKALGLLYNKDIQDSAYPRQIKFNFFENQSLVMPYRNVYGEIVAIVGRSILDEEARRGLDIEKYKNTQFTKGDHVFGLYEAKDSIIKSGFVYIVEGQFDVIKAFEHGLTNIVGLGTSSMTAYQLSLICRYANNILLLLDNDAAGEKGRRDIIKKYDTYANIQNIYLPDGYKDMDEYLQHNDVASMAFLSKKVIINGG